MIDLAKVITDKIRDDEESGAAEADWKFAAMVISRFKKDMMLSNFSFQFCFLQKLFRSKGIPTSLQFKFEQK